MNGFLIARHVETAKNRLGIHGTSTLDSISNSGHEQVSDIARICRHLGWVSQVVYAPTHQAAATAQFIADAAGLPTPMPLELSPVALGMASGKTQDELYRNSAQVAYSMEMFRFRATPASELEIPGAESLQNIVRRIRDWQESHGFGFLSGSLVIASSSILTMLANLIAGNLPGPDYYNYVAPAGSIRAFELLPNDVVRPAVPLTISSWPDSESLVVATSRGRVKASKFFPAWEARRASAIIIPGYFSNSRAGPYGLYTRLAQRLALEGIATYTYDPLGYGESDPVRRSLQSDIISLRAVVSQADSPHLILLGHSMAGAFVCLPKQDLGSSATNITRIALAPLNDLETILIHAMPAEESEIIRRHETLIRHGMPIDEEYIIKADELWRQGYETIDFAIFGASDHYVKPAWVPLAARTLMTEVDNADHNFSHTEAARGVIELVTRFVREATSSTKTRLGIEGPC